MARRLFSWVLVPTLGRKMSSSSTQSTIASQLMLVNEKIKVAAAKRPQHLQHSMPRLVAVSKTKGTDMIIEAYEAGQRHFGENYVVELHDKANDIEIQDLCPGIQWHFIGHLQRNKISKILDVPNLFVIETVDSEKLAKALNDSWERMKKSGCLRVMTQVNTSGETNKSGCSPKDALKVSKYIKDQCPHINLIGLMTIGSFDHNPNSGPNPDFKALYDIRQEVCEGLNISEKELELSMGMSSDYEQAIEMGSTNVRVGSTIFGERGSKDETSSSTSHTVEPNQKQRNPDINSALNNLQGLKLNT